MDVVGGGGCGGFWGDGEDVEDRGMWRGVIRCGDPKTGSTERRGSGPSCLKWLQLGLS